MFSNRLFGLVFVSCFLLAGCSTPEPNYIGPNGADSPLTIDDLARHIRCEIEGGTHIAELKKDGYAAQITLALKVEDSGGITPNLAYINGNLTSLLDANLSLDRQKTYSTQYVLDLTKLPSSEDCTTAKDTFIVSHNLSGDLGIKAIMEAGNDQISKEQYNFAANEQLSSSTPTLHPNFGATIQFIITKNFDAGPYWKITHFTGPSTSSKGLITGSRITTDNLIIAFSSVEKKTTTTIPNPDVKKLKEALDTALRQIKPTTQRMTKSQKTIIENRNQGLQKQADSLREQLSLTPEMS